MQRQRFITTIKNVTSYTDIHEKKVKVQVMQLYPIFCDPMDFTVHGIPQARILEWVAFPFSRGFFSTQGSNPGLLHCRRILYQLSHKGSPRTLEWVAYPFSIRSSWPRNPTGVSCIAGRFFTKWAIRESYRYTYTPISKIKTRKENKKANSTELQKPDIEAEVYTIKNMI